MTSRSAREGSKTVSIPKGVGFHPKERSAPVLLALFTGLIGISLGCQPASDTESASEAAATGPAPVEFKTDSGIAMIWIPGGTFMMGSSEGLEDEAPVHEVTLSAFAMDRTEVTQAEFEKLMTANPSHFRGPDRPVEQIRWTDAAEYCNARSLEEGLEPCYDELTFACDFSKNGYRLPTEAEWEYACRAGGEDLYAFAGAKAKLDAHSCYAGNSGKKTLPVGSKRPNHWGIHDMYGNVSEWCHDPYDPNYYSVSPAENPAGPSEGEKRTLRGGSWKSTPEYCRATFRMSDTSGISDACFAQDSYGFRCVRTLAAAPGSPAVGTDAE